MNRLHGEIFKEFIEKLDEKDLDLDRIIRGKPRMREPDNKNDEILDVENPDDYKNIMSEYDKVKKAEEENS